MALATKLLSSLSRRWPIVAFLLVRGLKAYAGELRGIEVIVADKDNPFFAKSRAVPTSTQDS